MLSDHSRAVLYVTENNNEQDMREMVLPFCIHHDRRDVNGIRLELRSIRIRAHLKADRFGE